MNITGKSYQDPQGRKITIVSEDTPTYDKLLSNTDLLPYVRLEREDGKRWGCSKALVMPHVEEYKP